MVQRQRKVSLELYKIRSSSLGSTRQNGGGFVGKEVVNLQLRLSVVKSPRR